jgi:hypothetical protein
MGEVLLLLYIDTKEWLRTQLEEMQSKMEHEDKAAKL